MEVVVRHVSVLPDTADYMTSIVVDCDVAATLLNTKWAPTIQSELDKQTIIACTLVWCATKSSASVAPADDVADISNRWNGRAKIYLLTSGSDWNIQL